MDPIREIPKKCTKKFGNKVINRQYFRRKTGLKGQKSKTNVSWLESRDKYIRIFVGNIQHSKL